MGNTNIREARTKFKMKTKMIEVKTHFWNDPSFSKDLWRCEDCRAVDTMSHILHCPAYQDLREGKNIGDERDVVRYYMEVMERRDRGSERGGDESFQDETEVGRRETPKGQPPDLLNDSQNMNQ